MEVLILSNAKYDADIVVRYDPKTPHLLPFSMSFSKDRSLSILRDEDLITRAHLYIRPLCNTTIIATSYSFDLLVDGTVERVRILLHASLAAASNLARTPHPDSLSSTTTSTIDGATVNTYHTASDAPGPRSVLSPPRLRTRRTSISLPMLSKGMDRVRGCLHAGNMRTEIDTLVNASVAWAASIKQEERMRPQGGSNLN